MTDFNMDVSSFQNLRPVGIGLDDIAGIILRPGFLSALAVFQTKLYAVDDWPVRIIALDSVIP